MVEVDNFDPEEGSGQCRKPWQHAVVQNRGVTSCLACFYNVGGANYCHTWLVIFGHNVTPATSHMNSQVPGN